MRSRVICVVAVLLWGHIAMLAAECSSTIAVTFDGKNPPSANAHLRLKAEVDGKVIPIDYSPTNQRERILIVLDASGSMNAWRTVVSEPNRWPAELDLASGLVAAIPPEIPVGLLVFGDGKVQKLPITTDHKAVAALIDSLRTFTPHGKTDFSNTAEEAKSMFDGGHVGDTLVALTDGADNDPTGVRKIADQLNDRGIRLWGVIFAVNRVHIQEPFIDAVKHTGGDVLRIEGEFSSSARMREAAQSVATRIAAFYEVAIRFAASSNQPRRLKLSVEQPPHVNAHYPATIPVCSETAAQAR